MCGCSKRRVVIPPPPQQVTQPVAELTPQPTDEPASIDALAAGAQATT